MFTTISRSGRSIHIRVRCGSGFFLGPVELYLPLTSPRVCRGKKKQSVRGE